MKKRYEYGVYVDLLHKKVAKSLQAKVDRARRQFTEKVTVTVDEQGNTVETWEPRKHPVRNLDDAANVMYESAINYIAQYGQKPGTSLPTVAKKRFHLLASANSVVFLTYTLKAIEADATAALKNGTKIFVLRPYVDDKLFCISSIGAWYELFAIEKAGHKQFAVNKEYSDWQEDLDVNLKVVLNTYIPWINPQWRLHTLSKQFQNFDAFMTYLSGRIAELEEKGEWDVETSSELVYNEKASTATYVSTKGTNKGMKTFWCKDTPDSVDYWKNYEVLPINIMTKFLHLTFLDSTIDKKDKPFLPLTRIVKDGAEYGTRKYFEFLTEQDIEDGACEQGLTVTPLYVDPYFQSESFTKTGVIEVKERTVEDLLADCPEELQRVVEAMGIETIKKLGYKAALKAIKFNLKNN